MSYPLRTRSMNLSRTKKEGPLKKWTNYMKGWKDRYFVLDQGVLSYCRTRGERMKGQIHIGVAKIIEHRNSRRKIVLDTGTSFLHLKAKSESERDEWLSALKACKVEMEAAPEPLRVSREETAETCAELRPLSQKLLELWELDCNLKAAIDMLPDQLRSQYETFAKLSNSATNIKTSLTEVMGFLEDQQMQIHKLREGNQSSSDEDEPRDEERGRKLPVVEEGDEEMFFDALDDPAYSIPNPNSIPRASAVSSLPTRTSLPVPRNPNQKFNIWKVIKDSIGGDLSKMSVPVYFNEPISFLQRFTEDLTFHHLLISADKAQDPCLRIALVGCFAVSGYASTVNRTMKPFNPVLGETFELEYESAKVISEQVSHHPPVTAIFSDHPNYTFAGNTQMKTSFKGTYLQLHPAGTIHVYLKSWDEHYTFIKPMTSVHNLIIGKIYVDHHGRIEVNCEKSGAKAVINLKKKGWFEKKLHFVEGSALAPDGSLQYIMEGTWSEGMTIHRPDSSDVLAGWTALPPYEGKEDNYYFSQFALQLNIPPESFSRPIPRSDSRWRPDQRALENGDTKVAKAEKERVEEKQRAVRKAREQAHEDYKPRWFSFIEEEWRYDGGYWEMKAAGEMVDIPDIF